MYDYKWDKKTRGIKLVTRTSKFVASEIRPVFAEELTFINADKYLEYDSNEKLPLMWAKQNAYIYGGVEIGKCEINEDGKRVFVYAKDSAVKKLLPVDVAAMLIQNKAIMDSLVADTLKRINEMYKGYGKKCDIVYIGFSGGKDSMLLLDLCHKVLPLSIPVVFSDTDMELPDTYQVWEDVKARYSEREFLKVRANKTALENWADFGPPSQNLRWCCAVHKSTPAILSLRELAGSPSAKTCAFVGVRADESQRRSSYDDISDGLKNQNQINAMPLLAWGAHELFLYSFAHNLILNPAYRKGLPRVGCILCPMSSERHAKLISEIYPNAVKPFVAQIKDSISREFASESDFDDFIFTGGWHARQSGVSLKMVLPDVEEVKKGSEFTYSFQSLGKNGFLEWLKTLGQITYTNDRSILLVKMKDSVAKVEILGNDDLISKIVCNVEDDKIKKSFSKYVKSVLHKAMACSMCRVCASECPTGAITFNEGIRINSDVCVHCMKCHSMQNGCWRFYSRRYAGGTTMNISGINKYLTFGLKQEWINILIDEGDNFRSTTSLGTRMIPAAITWFRESNLIADTTAVKLTRLIEIAKLYGSESGMLWSLIWISLANYSPLIKWYVCKTNVNEKQTVEALNQILNENVASESVRKGALQSLCATIKNSPIGNSSSNIVNVEQKGVRVLSLERTSVTIEPLAILYSLYVMAKVSGRTSFTLSEMKNADIESPFISPIVAFGLDMERMKAQCMGIATCYPEFLSCSFALGLDEIKVFPDKKTLDDVVGLILGE